MLFATRCFSRGFVIAWINSMQLFWESKFIPNALVGLGQFRGISQIGHICCEEHQVRQEWGEIKKQSAARQGGEKDFTGPSLQSELIKPFCTIWKTDSSTVLVEGHARNPEQCAKCTYELEKCLIEYSTASCAWLFYSIQGAVKSSSVLLCLSSSWGTEIVSNSTAKNNQAQGDRPCSPGSSSWGCWSVLTRRWRAMLNLNLLTKPESYWKCLR